MTSPLKWLPHAHAADPGRNEPCWCGSGKKFKKCHLNRHLESPLTKHEILRGFVKAEIKTHCMYVDGAGGSCRERSIRSHTIQRQGSLERIARAGHVYSFQADLMDRMNGKPNAVRLVGLRNASTFTGFCSNHDNAVFHLLDDEPFTPEGEKVALLTYRTICRELHAKERVLHQAPMYGELDRGRAPQQQRVIRLETGSYLAGTENAIPEMRQLKEQLEVLLAQRAFSRMHALVLDFQNVPDIMSAAVVNPEVDFDGNVLQTLGLYKRSELVSFQIVATDSGGAAVFGWLDVNPVAERLVASIDRIPDDRIADTMIRWAFEMSENTFARPSWWEQLATVDQQRLLHRMSTGGVLDRDPNALMDDGLHVASWGSVTRTRF